MRPCVSNRDLAINYLQAFCAGNLSRLDSLLAEDLNFRGPFHTFRSASEYMDSLRCDPPDECGFEICSITENENTVAVFYEYKKPDRTVQIAQLFEFKEQRIKAILIIFDCRDLL
jgi:hypothetical protein